MKKSFLMLPAMIALFSFAENNNNRINKVPSNEYLLAQQDPPENSDQAQPNPLSGSDVQSTSIKFRGKGGIGIGNFGVTGGFGIEGGLGSPESPTPTPPTQTPPPVIAL